ncbi:MAG TPA: TlpA disulfide reductase family protein [Burkholderiales bacterium]|jgi:thiol-disulfide isomerase/thioredoxin|nr:TlpA disulfide reductase family protein [Burkholderiales bacterium]
MATQRREALILVSAGVAAAAAGFVAGPILFGSGGSKPDAALLSIRFPDLAGRPRQLSEWRGRVVVCNFWATWCAPCREEMPLLVATRAKYAVKGVEVVGIAVDNAAKVREFSAALGITYPILLSDADGLQLMRDLGNTAGGLPYTVFLDREGRPVEHKLGALKAAELDRILSKMAAS